MTLLVSVNGKVSEVNLDISPLISQLLKAKNPIPFHMNILNVAPDSPLIPAFRAIWNAPAEWITTNLQIIRVPIHCVSSENHQTEYYIICARPIYWNAASYGLLCQTFPPNSHMTHFNKKRDIFGPALVISIRAEGAAEIDNLKHWYSVPVTPKKWRKLANKSTVARPGEDSAINFKDLCPREVSETKYDRTQRIEYINRLTRELFEYNLVTQETYWLSIVQTAWREYVQLGNQVVFAQKYPCIAPDCVDILFIREGAFGELDDSEYFWGPPQEIYYVPCDYKKVVSQMAEIYSDFGLIPPPLITKSILKKMTFYRE